VYCDSSVMIRELIPSRGFQSSVDYQIIFGLGQRKKIDSILVTWPDQTQTSLRNPAMDTLHIIPETVSFPAPAKTSVAQTLFTIVPVSFDKHTEDDYVDFYMERNIPQLLSREGPRAAVADVNGDGLEDIYIGGTLKRAGQLYIRQADGFNKSEDLSKQLLGYEDISAVFFDADNDGDNDLFLGAGGNNKPSFSKDMQNRLYINDGKGKFALSSKALPRNMGNTSVLLPFDIDDDGDLDVFAASRCMPANYGVTPECCVYINDGKGSFSTLSKEQCGPLTEAGMISGATFTGNAKDKNKILTVVGDWMGPRQFSFINNRFVELSTNLSAKLGWWQTISAADLDGDGDDDLVLGNLGANFYLKPDLNSPVKLWINAFSQNMLPEKIITRTIDGKDVPVFLKRDLTDQIPILKKQNLKHQDYAKKSIQDLFDANMIKTSEVKKVDFTASCIAWNEGKGKYTIMELPLVVQLSSVNSVLVTDINGDGKKDLLMGGNLIYWQPQFSRIDASYGHVLLNQGNRNWKYVPTDVSGIFVRGEVRDIKELDTKDKRFFLFLQNDDFPLMYSLNKK
jgi:enediyne biosynthesis protein E4